MSEVSRKSIPDSLDISRRTFEASQCMLVLGLSQAAVHIFHPPNEIPSRLISRGRSTRRDDEMRMLKRKQDPIGPWVMSCFTAIAGNLLLRWILLAWASNTCECALCNCSKCITDLFVVLGTLDTFAEPTDWPLLTVAVRVCNVCSPDGNGSKYQRERI